MLELACETEAGLDADPPSVRSNIQELPPGGLMHALVLGALGGLPWSARSRRKKMILLCNAARIFCALVEAERELSS